MRGALLPAQQQLAITQALNKTVLSYFFFINRELMHGCKRATGANNSGTPNARSTSSTRPSTTAASLSRLGVTSRSLAYEPMSQKEDSREVVGVLAKTAAQAGATRRKLITRFVFTLMIELAITT